MDRLIDNASECTVGQFIKCLFDKKYEVLVNSGKFTIEQCSDAFKVIYAEFLDLSKLIETEEFALMQSIFYLSGRVRRMEILISIQRESIEQTGQPFYPGLIPLKRYGHNIIWDKDNPDIQSFLDRIQQIEILEKSHKITLDEKQADMAKINAMKNIDDSSPMDRRKRFLRTKNSLQKEGYQIDNDKTYVDELALMICVLNEGSQVNIN